LQKPGALQSASKRHDYGTKPHHLGGEAMTSKWIDGKLFYKNEFRYIATATRRTVPQFKRRALTAGPLSPQLEFELYDMKPTVRRFEKRKDAEKWLSYEKLWGAVTRLDVRAAWFRAA
jgi:hypothetical protein